MFSLAYAPSLTDGLRGTACQSVHPVHSLPVGLSTFPGPKALILAPSYPQLRFRAET